VNLTPVAAARRYGRVARRAGRTVALIGLVAVLAACSEIGNPFGVADVGPDVPRPYPEACRDFELSPRRCAFIVDSMIARAGLAPAQVQRVELLGDTGCGDLPGPGGPVLCTRTQSFVVRVRLHDVLGGMHEESQFCGVGGQYTFLCSDEPVVALSLPTEGYRDVPCMGDSMDTCATPLPDPDAAAADAEEPLVIPALDINLDRTGLYDIPLGRGSLANGILEESSVTLADPTPADILLSEAGIRLQIQSLAPNGRPFDNYYAHGRVDGVEPFDARLTFEVLSYEPGAVIRLGDILVR
jgi:hypothetical protein